MTDKETTGNESILFNLENALIELINSHELPKCYRAIPALSEPTANGRFPAARRYLDLLPSRVLMKQQIDELENEWKRGNFQIVLDRIQHLRSCHSDLLTERAMTDNQTIDVKKTVSDIISKRDPRDIYKPGGGPTDHFRRSDVQEMLEEAYKLGWNGALRACVLPTELQ